VGTFYRVVQLTEKDSSARVPGKVQTQKCTLSSNPSFASLPQS
jgi:hypothetical protein